MHFSFIDEDTVVKELRQTNHVALISLELFYMVVTAIVMTLFTLNLYINEVENAYLLLEGWKMHLTKFHHDAAIIVLFLPRAQGTSPPTPSLAALPF